MILQVLLLSFILVIVSIVSDTVTCPVQNKRWADAMQSLESEYRSHKGRGNITILFGHIHHAGGTAVCQLARKNTIANPTSNCNHPNQFSGANPVTGSTKQQLQFQRSTPWKFYMTELKMPKNMIFGGPFLYGIVLRHPYLLLLSQQRRAKLIHKLNLTVQQYVALQHHKAERGGGPHLTATSNNTLRGQAGFILGRYGATNMSDMAIFEAVKRRLDRFSVLLLTEDMVSSGQLFSLKWGWEVDTFGKQRVNSHGDWTELLDMYKGMSNEDKEFMERHTSVDMRIYHYARCVVQRELARVGHTLGEYSLQYFDDIIAG